jgi:hypothetical protein
MQSDKTSETAALLAIGTANEWQPVNVEHHVVPSDIESYIATTAKAHGVDPNKSFPFQARGTLVSYIMHVNAAPTDGPHGMGLPMAVTVMNQGDQLNGQVAGLYVSPDLVGIATRAAKSYLLNDLVRAHQDRWRHGEPKRFGGLHIDDPSHHCVALGSEFTDKPTVRPGKPAASK